MRKDASPLLDALGDRVRSLRLAQDLSQEGLAKRVGVTGRYIRSLERGQGSPTAEFAVDLADALGTTIADLLEPSSRADPESAALTVPMGKVGVRRDGDMLVITSSGVDVVAVDVDQALIVVELLARNARSLKT